MPQTQLKLLYRIRKNGDWLLQSAVSDTQDRMSVLNQNLEVWVRVNNCNPVHYTSTKVVGREESVIEL